MDSNNDGIHNDSEQVLKDINIKLFEVKNIEKQGEKDEEVRVLRENPVHSTKTNESGEFRFFVNEGAYSVNLDVESLPLGKGVVETNKVFDIGEAGRIDFAVRDIESMHVYDKPFHINIGEDFIVNPVAKDRDGNVLSAKIIYRSEDRTLDFHSNLCRTLPKSLRDTSTQIILDTGNTKWEIPVDIRVPRLCSVDKVNLAHRLGLIDEHTKVRHLVHALHNRSKLPDDYYSRVPIKSGTRAVEEIKRYIMRTDADPKVVEAARQFLSSTVPVLDHNYKSPSGYFSIHYTLSGENAVSSRGRDSRAVPPYIEQIGLAFDQVRADTCTVRGFREPILEEGKDAFDIYVFDQKGKYGVTYTQIFSAQNTRARVASSYICIDNSYSSEKGFDKNREDCMKVTAAHEFFHAVQSAYNADADLWWKEASATWNEDEVYTGINDYVRYVNGYFSAPFKPLDESSYSGVIFAKFLSENYGGNNTIKRIWEMQSSGYNNSIDAIDRVIRESYSGKDLGMIFNQFSSFNVNPSQYYKEGALWKASAAAQNTYSSYPVAVNLGQLNHLSSNYQLFKPIDIPEGKSLRIVVDGADRARWGFKLQKRKRSDNMYSTTEITSNGAFKRAEIILKNFGEVYDEIYFIPANLEKARDNIAYIYSASIE